MKSMKIININEYEVTVEYNNQKGYVLWRENESLNDFILKHCNLIYCDNIVNFDVLLHSSFLDITRIDGTHETIFAFVPQ